MNILSKCEAYHNTSNITFFGFHFYVFVHWLLILAMGLVLSIRVVQFFANRRQNSLKVVKTWASNSFFSTVDFHFTHWKYKNCFLTPRCNTMLIQPILPLISCSDSNTQNKLED